MIVKYSGKYIFTKPSSLLLDILNLKIPTISKV